MDTIGQRIRAIRKENAMTQKEFCEFICISQAYLSGVEHDKATPSKAVIRLISLIFEIKESWIITGK